MFDYDSAAVAEDRIDIPAIELLKKQWAQFCFDGNVMKYTTITNQAIRTAKLTMSIPEIIRLKEVRDEVFNRCFYKHTEQKFPSNKLVRFVCEPETAYQARECLIWIIHQLMELEKIDEQFTQIVEYLPTVSNLLQWKYGKIVALSQEEDSISFDLFHIDSLLEDPEGYLNTFQDLFTNTKRGDI